MMYCHPLFDAAINTDGDKVQTIIIENADAYSELLRDIASSIAGNEEQSALFNNGKKLSFYANAELLSSFFPFELNRKTLLSKIVNAIEKEALTSERYLESMKIVSSLEAYLSSLAEAFDCNLFFGKISPASIIKSSGLEILDDYSSLPEKILDYFEAVREFEREKIFFTVNLRSFLSDSDADVFLRSIVAHEFSVIMFENKNYRTSEWEKRLIVDADLCTIE